MDLWESKENLESSERTRNAIPEKQVSVSLGASGQPQACTLTHCVGGQERKCEPEQGKVGIQSFHPCTKWGLPNMN